MTSPDAERQELDRAIALLGPGTRSGRLLQFLGEKYFQQQPAQLSEFTIATEVFGRSKDHFDAGQDAIVRVETHRLRKKLRDIYEKDGARELQISLPAGTYVPQFSRAPAPQPADEPRRAGKRALYFAIAIGSLCAAIFGAMKLSQPGHARQNLESSSQSRPAQPAGATSGGSAAGGEITELHLLAGYGGSDVIDGSGVRWTPDRFFSGGTPWGSNGEFVQRTSRQFLFANWRNGEFGYDIPLRPGTYELRLFFVSPLHAGEEKLSDFDVSLNGKPLLTAFDVNRDAAGADVADEKIFRDIVPVDGFLRLRFTNKIGTPSLNALEIVPGIPRKQKAIRITTKPNSFVDHKGQRWRADDYYLNGYRTLEHRTVSGTEDPELFGAERFGHFSYAIPVDTRGRYTVILHFAEFYFGPQLPGGGGVGSRIFHVICNGQKLLEDFDIFKEAGSMRVVTKTFTNVKPSAQGKISLIFEPVVNNATISGIEVLDESD